jgi:Xaa-Pro aminopeptidase
MDRLQEINVKHDQVRALLRAHNAETLWLRRVKNIAWITAGADASIAIDGDFGAYSVMVTAEKRVIITDNIEETRLRAEENFEALGFEFAVSRWYESQPPAMPGLIVDDGEVGDALQKLRMVLSPGEQERARGLGLAAGAAVEAAARATRPGDTEWLLAARLQAECRERGGIAVVALVASDERISQFRHPLPTMKQVQNYAMLVVCMRRAGLIVSATRLVHFGTVPDELRAKLQQVAAIDAAAMVATRPGRTIGDVFADIQAAYAAQGVPDQWQYHHQGGPAGYGAREIIATPGDSTLVEANQLYAWNPSVVGCKSEDTILVGDNGFEIISQTGNWPTVDVQINGQTVKRPDILSL